MDEELIKGLMSSMKCHICGRRYRSSDIEVIGHQENVWFLSVYCSSCAAHALVAAVIKMEEKPAKIGDLTGESGPVSADDVLDMHNLLKDFKGSISELLIAK